MRRSGSKGILETDCYCKIRLLDDSEISCEFKKDSKGQAVFDQSCKELDLLEKDYFGLRYVDVDKQRHWLDLNKNLIKQMKTKPPYTLFFRVKFYPQDPGKIVEEITRYHLFVQVKRDILHGRLLCSFNDLADLGGYIVQDELGDYDPEDHKEGYLSEFRVVPKQNEKLESKIGENHKNLSGLTPSDCEKDFLDKVKLLEMYGVDPHPCKDQEGVQLYLGLTPEGIAIIREAKKVSGFPWSDVLKVSYDSKVFYVQIQKEERKANYGFRLPDHGACKHLWKCAIEHHTFYSNEVKPGKVRRSSSLSPQRFFKRHSKYQYSGRTQDQVIQDSLNIQRPNPEIKRTPSIRISARPDMSKTSSEASANNNGNLADTPTGDGSTSTASGSDPLKEFETEHIPDIPTEDHNDSLTNINGVDGKLTGTENGPVAVVGSARENGKSEGESNMALSVIFILLLVALILIPVAIVVQSNKEAIQSSGAYKSFAVWLESVTGASIL